MNAFAPHSQSSTDQTATPISPTKLQPRHEAFAQAYAGGMNGADAARDAGFAPASASNQATRLLGRADVAARITVLSGARAAARGEIAAALMAKLEPVYCSSLAAGDVDAVLQVVELQARIAGLVHGSATVRPRGPDFAARRAQERDGRNQGHEEFLDMLE